jgi:hypothetical protein
MNPSASVPFVLTDAALIAIDSDDAPTLTLTPAALQALEEERKKACADVLMAELNRYPAMRLMFAEHFKQAYQAHDDYEAAVGLNNVKATSMIFSQACEGLFFLLKAHFDMATRETSL